MAKVRPGYKASRWIYLPHSISKRPRIMMFVDGENLTMRYQEIFDKATGGFVGELASPDALNDIIDTPPACARSGVCGHDVDCRELRRAIVGLT